MDLDKAFDEVLKNVNRSIKWNTLYNKLWNLLGDDFDGRTPFYESVDEIMLEKGFRIDDKCVPTYYRKSYKPKTKRINRNESTLF